MFPETASQEQADWHNYLVARKFLEKWKQKQILEWVCKRWYQMWQRAEITAFCDKSTNIFTVFSQDNICCEWKLVLRRNHHSGTLVQWASTNRSGVWVKDVVRQSLTPYLESLPPSGTVIQPVHFYSISFYTHGGFSLFLSFNARPL